MLHVDNKIARRQRREFAQEGVSTFLAFGAADKAVADYDTTRLPARLAAFEKNGSTLVGDCDPATAFPRASRYTPVPGGVGPLTIAHLLLNTLRLCEARRG